MDRENDIRLIAYHIWEVEGCPEGRDCEHWAQAEMIWEVDNKKKAGSGAVHKAAGATVKTAKKTAASAKKSSKK